METLSKTRTHVNNWIDVVDMLGMEFASRAAEYDRTDTFVKENYDLLKEHGFLTAMIPEELGGGGATHSEMCNILKRIAFYDGSTALALSMHQHLLGANIWKYKNGKGGEEVLRKVADKQLVLISTGAKDWLESNGKMEKVKDGYLVTAQKDFASQSAIGDILVTSAPFEDPTEGWQVLHFSVPINVHGVSRLDNWYTMGMRGTGSQTVNLERVFIPESAIILRRPRGQYHPFWNIVITIALPLIMSVYAGIAERAARVTIEQVKKQSPLNPHLPYLLGEMNNELTVVKVLLKDMIHLTNDFNFAPIDETGHEMLTRKTLLANASIHTVERCMHAVGGKSYYRSMELERLFRDVQASSYHLLSEKNQQHFSGEYLIKNA